METWDSCDSHTLGEHHNIPGPEMLVLGKHEAISPNEDRAHVLYDFECLFPSSYLSLESNPVWYLNQRGFVRVCARVCNFNEQ